jgi:hypothetical protein
MSSENEPLFLEDEKNEMDRAIDAFKKKMQSAEETPIKDKWNELSKQQERNRRR